MSTSSGSRVRLEGTIATSSNPYARLACFPAPISNSISSPLLQTPVSRERPPGEGQAFGASMQEWYRQSPHQSRTPERRLAPGPRLRSQPAAGPAPRVEESGLRELSDREDVALGVLEPGRPLGAEVFVERAGPAQVCSGDRGLELGIT